MANFIPQDVLDVYYARRRGETLAVLDPVPPYLASFVPAQLHNLKKFTESEIQQVFDVLDSELDASVAAAIVQRSESLLSSSCPPVYPTLFHNRGTTVSDLGLKNWCNGLVTSVLDPLARTLYSDLLPCGLNCEDFFAFVLHHNSGANSRSEDLPTPLHGDESVLTFHVCLQSDVQGGELGFATDEVIHTCGLKPGRIVVHPGPALHFTKPILSGSRASLIVYTVAARVPPCAFPSRFQSGTAQLSPFYAQYEFYLSQRTLKEERHRIGHAQGFSIPSLPPALVRLAHRLLRHTAPTAFSAPAGLSQRTIQLPVRFICLPPDVLRILASLLTPSDQVKLAQCSRPLAAVIGVILPAVRQAYWEVDRQEIMKTCAYSAGSSREIVHLHVGGIGMQLGQQIWELYGLEARLNLDGMPFIGYESSQASSSFFMETGSGKWRPRAVFADLEPFQADSLRTGQYRQLFAPDQIVTGREGTAGCFAAGNHTYGKELIDLLLDRIRRQTEACSGLQGFMISHALGGGTGSGLTALLLERLRVDYDRKVLCPTSVYPGSGSATEYYNAVLGWKALHDFADVCFTFDYHRLCSIARRYGFADAHSAMVDEAALEILSRFQSMLSHTLRWDGALNSDLSEFSTNLIPFPTLKHVGASQQPLYRRPHSGNASVAELCNAVFEVRDFSPNTESRGVYMATTLHFFGDIVPKDVMAAIASIKTKRTIQFVDWCPTGFKCGLVYQPVVKRPGGFYNSSRKGCLHLFQSTAIRDHFCKLASGCQLAYAKRSFVHHYVAQGMDEGSISGALSDIDALCADYTEIECPRSDTDPEEEI